MKKTHEQWFSVMGWIGLLGEGLTGALLLIAPLFTLGLMGVKNMPAEPVYVQFIGVFVFSMGVFYTVPRWYRNGEVRLAAWRAVFLGTGILRVIIAVFTAQAMIRGHLDMGWISLPFYDGTIALVQFYLLAKEARG